jgi:hypothetical protein
LHPFLESERLPSGSRRYSYNESGDVSTALKHSLPGEGLAHKSPARLSNRVVALGRTRNFTKFENHVRVNRAQYIGGSASGPARRTATNSALAGQFPAGQRQRFVNGL